MAQQATTHTLAEAATAQEAAHAAQAAHVALQQQLQNQPQPQGHTAGGVAVAGAAARLLANLPMIDWPPGTRWSMQEAMQLLHVEYVEIQVSTPRNGLGHGVLTSIHGVF